MAFVKKEANKKNRRHLQLKKVKKVVQVQQKEDNDDEDMDSSDEAEDDHDFERDEAEDKELDSEIEDDERDDNEDEENNELNGRVSTLQKKLTQIKEQKKEKIEQGKKAKKSDKKNTKNKAPTKVTKKGVESNEKTKESNEEKDARSLFVGNLPDGVTEQDLRGLSKDIVEIYVQKTGWARFRFAFLRFNNEAAAETNYNILKTKKIKDKPLSVDYVGSKSLYNGNLGKEERNARKLFVGGLPDDITEQELKSLSDDIVEIFIPQRTKKFAFLTFDSQAKAVSNYENLKDLKIRGKPILVEWKGSKTAPTKDGGKRSHNGDFQGEERLSKKIRK